MNPASSFLMVGRDAELLLLDRLVDSLVTGAGRALWIDGEPGIGKTLTCDLLAAKAGARGVVVRRGAAEEAAEPFPLRPVTAAFAVTTRSTDPQRAEIAQLLRGGGTGVLDPVLAAVERMLEHLDQVCTATPSLIMIEDLQWADDATVLWWERLARTVDQLPVLLVGTCHPAPSRPAVRRLREVAHESLASVVRLGPLSAAGVDELAGRLSGAPPVDALRARLAHAGGNPLFVRELVTAWQDGDRTGQDADRPASVTAASSRHLRLLGTGTRAILRVAALLGREFEVAHLAAVDGRRPTQLTDALQEALAAGILTESGTRLAFRHELIRRVLAGETAKPVRVALHAQIARALASAGADVGVVAGHLTASDGSLDSWAVAWLADIEERVLLVVPDVAADLLARATRVATASAARWETLAERLVVVCAATGRDDEAERTAAEVVRHAGDPGVRGRVQLYRIRLANRRGDVGQALAVATVALADPQVPPLWAARLRSRLAAVRLKQGRHAEAAEQARLALEVATAVADGVGSGHSRLVLHAVSPPEEGLAHLDAALAGLGGDHESTELRLLLLNNKLAALNNLGRPDAFAATVDETLIVVNRAGTPRAGGVAGAAAMGCFDFGAWDDALVHLDSIEPPQLVSVLMVRDALAALIAGHREDWPRLRAHVDAADDLPITTGDVRILSGYLVAARALRAEADGEPRRAVEEFSYWLADDLGHDAKERFMWLPTLVRLALAVGDTDTAHRACAAADADAATPRALIRHGLAARFCRAQLDSDVTACTDIAQLADRHGWSLLRAAAHEEEAVRLAEAGATVEARAALNAAVRTYTGMGATFDVRRADARLRAHHVRRGPRGMRRRPDTGWAALTPAEAQVARLVAAGMSNPDIAAELFVSRRTAQTHVSRILRKLQVTSRIELITSASRAP